MVARAACAEAAIRCALGHAAKSFGHFGRAMRPSAEPRVSRTRDVRASVAFAMHVREGRTECRLRALFLFVMSLPCAVSELLDHVALHLHHLPGWAGRPARLRRGQADGERRRAPSPSPQLRSSGSPGHRPVGRYESVSRAGDSEVDLPILASPRGAQGCFRDNGGPGHGRPR